jgi:ABC-type branched-subunit amino acid transport system ATPase component
MALLEIEGLSKRYSGVLAVDGVSLNVQSGEILGLIGANGAGKTTLFNLISGFTPATSGRVRIGDEDVSNYPAFRRAKCGMARTFQTPQLFGSETVRENVLSGTVSDRLGWLLRRGRRSAGAGRSVDGCDVLLERFGLAAMAGMRAASLPYGAQRKLEMARAMMTGPRILMLDEPAAGMLPSEMAELNRLIEGIRAGGCTVVLVEHNMSVVMNVCDRIAVLEFGRLIADGTPAEIRANAAVKRAYFGDAA